MKEGAPMPPTPLQLQILLALTRGNTYAAELNRWVAEDSQSVFLIRDGTFYPVLEHLVTKGFIEVATRDRKRLRQYHLTQAGWALLRHERRRVGRLNQLLFERVVI
jgi:DNA-binding PadR family transcriptional regulator